MNAISIQAECGEIKTKVFRNETFGRRLIKSFRILSAISENSCFELSGVRNPIYYIISLPSL